MIKSTKTKVGDWMIVFVCLILMAICLIPFVNVAVRSISSSEAVIRRQVTLWPIGVNFMAYKQVLSDVRYLNSMAWTAVLTVICTFVSMFMTIICAYPLSYDSLKGRKFFNTLIILTMYFSAGIIPNYLLYKDLGLLNTPLVLIIPNCLSVFNMIIMRSFFYGIPESLRESAELDGAGPIRILVSIYLPLSTAVIATLSLFYAVGRWNGFSDALMFLDYTSRQYHPIQLLLYNIIMSITTVDVTLDTATPPGLSETIKTATVMIATIPILLVYPWLQKYFVKGVTIGAVKG